MSDFSVFDFLLDSVFVVDADGKVVYCNDVAASLCQSSVRRLANGKSAFSDIIKFDEPGLLPFTEEAVGRQSPSPLIETAYSLLKAEKKGKTQLTVRPVGDGKHWVYFLHDVSLEETLAAKYRAELAKTEEYARNLEKLVEARTAELRKVNQTLNAILDSLGQGFFTFGENGTCGDVFTRACKETLEKIPKGLKANDVLGVPASEVGQFHKWTDSMFRELLPFDDLKTLGPGVYPHSDKKHIVLEYYPIRQDDKITDVVVVATDKTAEREAQVALEVERQYASMVVKYMKNKEQFHQFLASVRVSLNTLMEIAKAPLNAEQVQESFRVLHTIEGEAGTFSLRELRLMSRHSQQLLEPFKNGAVMADWDHEIYLDSLRHLGTAFEAFLHENSSIIQIPTGQVGRTVEVSIETAKQIIAELGRGPGGAELVRKYEDLFLLEPIESRLKYYDGLAQSVAEKLGKKLKPMIIDGGEFRLNPEPYQKFFSSLVHAFRNAVDHGLEAPEEREWAGKDPAGQIKVVVQPDSTGLHLQISDDGQGIDPGVIREKLKKKFPDKDFSKASDQEVIQQVCMPGFSSRDSVGEFSGRGVGLDALREEVLKMNGTLEILSTVGQGTTLMIFIPLTPAQTFARSA